MLLKKCFYQRDTLKIARDLLGCFFVCRRGKKIIKGIIVETEAYIGEKDLACHASRGRTPRTEIMYGEAGRAYIYFIYGMYFCFNIVTEKKDFPAAVLIRAIKIENIDFKKTNGPGKLCKFLKINQKLNGLDITKKDKIWIEKKTKNFKIYKSKRIGIDYAGHCKHYLWRFYVKFEK